MKIISILLIIAAIGMVFTACNIEGELRVIYHDNGATGGEVPVDERLYKPGETVTVRANTGNLVKTGSTFAGWNTASDGSGTTYSGGVTFVMGDTDEDLYVLWPTQPTYTVTYNANGATSGTVPVDSNNYTQGQTVTVLGNTGNLVKSGGPFYRWNTASNGSGTFYSGGNTFPMGSANVTLYAIFYVPTPEP